MATRIVFAAFVGFVLILALPLPAQEHPRPVQPMRLPQQITQRQPGNVQTHQVSSADISGGIKKQIARDEKKSSDRKFHVKYQGKDLALDLIKVHDDRLSNLGGGKYFACVDMKGTNGKTYDIDFFMAGNPGAMNVTETSVHKINGKPLYNWKEERGVWKKVSA
jgi:hypothetical protein